MSLTIDNWKILAKNRVFYSITQPAPRQSFIYFFEMCNLFGRRERCCNFSLRTGCFIFVFVDVILCISFVFIKFSRNLKLFVILTVIILSISSIILFFGIYKGQMGVLWLFIGAVVVLSECAGTIFVACLIVLVYCITRRKPDTEYLPMLRILFSFFTFMFTLITLFFVVQIFIIRSYQLELREQRKKKQYELHMERKNVV